MQEQIYDSMSNPNLKPTDYITLMFERTDEDGILYIPGWHYDKPGWEHGTIGATDENDSYRCCVDWNLGKYEKLIEHFTRLYEQIEKIAPFWEDLDTSMETAQQVLKDKDLVATWCTYLRPFGIPDIDYELLCDINERWDKEEWVKEIAREIASGNDIENYQKEVLSEYIDTRTTSQEKSYYHQYLSKLHKAAEERVGKGICAYDVVFRSRRLCRLLNLGAPRIIVNSEARTLAAALLLHKYGISKEVVDNRIRLRLEMLEMMDDDELDELYRPKKMNGRKSLAPLFVYEILSKESSSKKHLRQQDILKELEKYPYEISLERKAIGRMIQNLVDSQYGIYSDKTGVWMDKGSNE